ncbi:transposase [Myxococcota bacterium]|nr:transposase [Myxococcota bacterium]MBU1537982.1 transposase [Myxococcota bacterium]
MHTEYHKWFSPHLGKDMEIKIYGHGGKPIVVFPAQGGKFYEFEDFQMVQTVEWALDQGIIQLFTVDSVDNESWGNTSIAPWDRAARHESYDKYIVYEVVPFIRHKNPSPQSFTTGVSMGGYHSGNFFFRHPDCFDGVISLSGLFQLSLFVGDYMDDNVYFNSPLHFLPRLHDEGLLNLYRRSHIIVCCGTGAWEDEMRHDIGALSNVLREKQIPAWIDMWGQDVNHDWPWWRKQFPYFISKLHEQGAI